MKEMISIIVPVYNAEKYLNRCVNSILNQTYENKEIILIDDGSTDRSGSICESYKNMYSNIKVVHKKNGGSTSARRLGVELAEGNFIGFVDSDDWIERDMYASMVEIMVNNDADMVTQGCWEENNGSIIEQCDGVVSGTYENEDIVRIAIDMFDINRKGLLPYSCCKLYNKDKMHQTMMQISDEVTIGEDVLTNFIYMLRCKEIVVTDNKFYHYVKNSGSVTHVYNDNFLQNVHFLYKCAYAAGKDIVNGTDFKTKLDIYTSKLLISGINNLMGFEEDAKLPFFRIPVNLFWKSSTKIVLYGAGRVGEAYYKQLMETKDVELVLWIDKNYLELQKRGKSVQTPEAIKKMDFDYIVIGVKEEKLATSIKLELMDLYGIEAEKICWKQPEQILYSF